MKKSTEHGSPHKSNGRSVPMGKYFIWTNAQKLSRDNPFKGEGPVAVGEAACLESRRSRVHLPLWYSGPKKQMFLSRSLVRSLCDREVACSPSDHKDSNFESCVWMAVSSHSSHHPQDVLLTSLAHVCTSYLKPHSLIYSILIQLIKPALFQCLLTI